MPLVEAAVDNALIHLKDELLNQVNKAYEESSVEVATLLLADVCSVLEHNRELFIVMGYGYKGRELAERVMQAVAVQLGRLHPKNTKDRSRLNSVLGKATDLRYK